MTREDAGADGWLRLFSGRFGSESEARQHLTMLKSRGRRDAFVVVYINGRRIPLLEAGTTATAGIANLQEAGQTVEERAEEVGDNGLDVVGVEGQEVKWQLQLGAYSSTIPVRLANAILDAPLEWQVRSVREGGLTRYVTRPSLSEEEVSGWLRAAREMGFVEASMVELD